MTKLEQWGTEQEICQLDNAYKKRTALQQEIIRRNKKINQQARRLRLQPILQAWRQAERYTKENAKEIQYPRKPIIDMTNTRNRSKKREPEEQNIRAETDTEEES